TQTITEASNRRAQQRRDRGHTHGLCLQRITDADAALQAAHRRASLEQAQEQAAAEQRQTQHEAERAAHLEAAAPLRAQLADEPTLVAQSRDADQRVSDLRERLAVLSGQLARIASSRADLTRRLAAYEQHRERRVHL